MKRVSSGMIYLCALLLSSCSRMKSTPEAPPPAPVSGTVGESAVTATATVKKIDKQKRLVTLAGPRGTITVKAGDQVRNFDQIKVGDDVVVTYYESMAYEVKKPGEATPGVSVADGVDRAKLGDKPAASGARITTITATITGIDKKNGTVTLTGPDGDAVTVKARNPANLERVKTGDLVEITLTEAVAVSVQPAAKGY